MDFNNVIKENLSFIFQRFDLKIVEEWDNYLKLKSSYVTMIIAYNNLEKSNNFYLLRNTKKSNSIEINDEILNQFFKSKLKLSEVPIETFIKNITLLFENEINLILEGDNDKLEQLEKFILKHSKNYTDDLVERQNLSEATKAWDNKDYQKFIFTIDKTGIDKLELSYQLKYNIARKYLH